MVAVLSLVFLELSTMKYAKIAVISISASQRPQMCTGEETRGVIIDSVTATLLQNSTVTCFQTLGFMCHKES